MLSIKLAKTIAATLKRNTQRGITNSIDRLNIALNNRVQITNGHYLFEVKPESNLETGTISPDTVDKAVKMASAQGQSEVALTETENTVKYPNFDDLYRHFNSNTKSLTLSTEYLIEIAKLVQENASDRQALITFLVPDTEGKQIVTGIKFFGRKGLPNQGLVMPVKVRNYELKTSLEDSLEQVSELEQVAA